MITRSMKSLLSDSFAGEWGSEAGDVLTPVLRTANFNDDGSLDYDSPAFRCIPEKKVLAKRMYRGDIILEKSGGTPNRPVGIMAYYDSDDEALCSNFNHILRFDDSAVNSFFMFHQLRWLRERGAFAPYTRKTTGLQNLQMKAFVDLELKVPPKAEQDKAAIAIRAIDAERNELKVFYNGLDELVKSRFVEMFGSCDEERFVPLKEVCSVIADGTHQPPKFYADGIPFLFVSNIANDVLTYETGKYITEEDYKALIKRTPIEVGDVLVSAVGSFGHPAVVREERPFCFQRHIAYLKPIREMIDSDYLHAALRSEHSQRYMDQAAKGVAQRTVTLKSFKELLIPLPSLSLQQEFAAFVRQVDKLEFETQQAIDKLQMLYDSLAQEYFALE